MIEQIYTAREVAELLKIHGNMIQGIKVGGGLMGHRMAHENEAPYPVALPQWFIRSHCPEGGTVLDPFCGSGTTVHAALPLGRNGIGIDIRESQIDLAQRRVKDVLDPVAKGMEAFHQGTTQPNFFSELFKEES